MRPDKMTNHGNLTPLYNSLLSCDKSFFGSLSENELKTCHKLADYFLGVHREKVDDADLYHLQVSVDNFKKKEWTPGKSTMSEQALEAIYEKFHPQKMTIDVLPPDLLRYHILPQAAEIQTNKVSKAWAVHSQVDEVWEGIAKEIGCPKLSAAPGQLHVEVKKYCQRLMRGIARQSELYEDINELMKGEINTEKMRKLIEWCKARDAVNVWEEIVWRLQLQMPTIIEDEKGDKVEQAKHFTQWLNDNSTSLMSLATLNLRKGLDFLPPEIGRLTALKELVLDRNNLINIPPEIGSLHALQKLCLDQNYLSTLPVEIGNLTSLTELSVCFNKLTHLPPEIGRLTALRELSLNHNKLIQFPPEIGYLKALRVLYVDKELTASLPSEIRHSTALRDLKINGKPLINPSPEMGA